MPKQILLDNDPRKIWLNSNWLRAKVKQATTKEEKKKV